MTLLFKRGVASMALFAVAILIAYESRNHFNKELIPLKRQHNSAQQNWNVFYGQRFAYYDGMFRYQEDLAQIKTLFEPGNIVLSDLATSYYVAASLPAYVRNVHRHQGRTQSSSWKALLDDRLACYLDQEDFSLTFKEFVYEDRKLSDAKGQPKFNYIIVNKDLYNKNARQDCLWNRRSVVMDNIADFTKLVFEGKYLNLYLIEGRLPTLAPQGN